LNRDCYAEAAISLCMDNSLPIQVFNLATPGNVRRAVLGNPIGTLVELEGSAQGIEALTVQLGRAQSDYITETYYELFIHTGNTDTTASPHMIFGSVT